MIFQQNPLVHGMSIKYTLWEHITMKDFMIFTYYKHVFNRPTDKPPTLTGFRIVHRCGV